MDAEYFSKACEHVKKNKNIKVWQNGYHAEHIYSNKFIRQKLDYIHNNPVKIELLLCRRLLLQFSGNYASLDNDLKVILLDSF
jgi:transcriptional regulator of met regulon